MTRRLQSRSLSIPSVGGVEDTKTTNICDYEEEEISDAIVDTSPHPTEEPTPGSNDSSWDSWFSDDQQSTDSHSFEEETIQMLNLEVSSLQAELETRTNYIVELEEKLQTDDSGDFFFIGGFGRNRTARTAITGATAGTRTQ